MYYLRILREGGKNIIVENRLRALLQHMHGMQVTPMSHWKIIRQCAKDEPIRDSKGIKQSNIIRCIKLHTIRRP